MKLTMLSTGSMTTDLGNFLEGETGDITFPVPIYVVEHEQGLVVVDAGLHPDLAHSDQRMKKLAALFRVELTPDDTIGPLLSANGYDPAQVSHVILTHLHFDHVGGLLQLPNATVVVQGAEWGELNDERKVALGSYNPDDVDLGHERLELEGDHDLFGDGAIECLLTDGHTIGHQSVRLRLGDDTILICGDCCYLRRSLVDEHLPPTPDPERHLASLRRLADEQRDGARLIFGHDPEQWATIQREGLP